MSYKLEKLLDVIVLQQLLYMIYKYMEVPSKIIDVNNNVLVTCDPNNKICINITKEFLNKFKSGQGYIEIQCINGLNNICIPIIVNKEVAAVICEAISEDKQRESINFICQLAKNFGYICSRKIQLLIEEDQLNERYEEIRGVYEALIVAEEEIRKQFDKLMKSQKLLKEREEKIYNLAFIDSLTGLPNKNSLYRDLENMCEKKNLFALIFIDIDKFKEINDTFGHTFGDKVLEEFSLFLNKFTGYKYRVYRWGGDEFVLILETKFAANTKEFLEKMNSELGNTIMINDKEIFITSSMGVSIYPEHGSTPEELIKNADIAMYTAKSLRKNSCVNYYKIYDKEFYINKIKKITLEKDLRKAFDNNEFYVFYQPQIDIKTEKLIGAEALVRWINKEGKVIAPSAFIPSTEETGLIVPLGEYVLKTSCNQAKRWHDIGYPNLKLSVNLSGRQLEDKELISTVKKILYDTKFNPKYLELEITESIAMKNMNLTIQLLETLKAININVALDDFGTGYSSLNYLRQFPINVLKIDKSFIDKITTKSAESEIIKCIISLAHSLNLKIIAEGIENIEQLKSLKSIDCDEGQGYYFSKPLSAKAFEEYLKNHYKA
ncbi:EAL domain-containing protein [Clostridium ganghwense]|uniref:EAL domain-containing protein n=1 Tax=Clostridium ganghwense TaxID=312089 RepID=A0ABT4CJB1_9CLOT|nr:EAL domain-containing protein [Clostridium ganghwense]MCY6369132.1 EAL domain-containing protein [Clostridium ganghwense]